MRARTFRNGTNATNDSPYVRAQPPSRGRSFHLATAILLLIGLLAPFVTLQNTLAAPVQTNRLERSGTQQQDNTPPPLPGVVGVAIGGDVADLVGTVPLNPSGDGFWSGTVVLGPGDYNYQIVVSTNFGEVVLGENGLESPPAGQASLTVPEGAQAAIFSFNENTGEVNAGGLIYEVLTEAGQFVLTPDGDGNFEVYFNATPGAVVTIQPLVLGQPTGETGQVTADDSGRVHVVLNASGQIQTAEPVQTATLTILKTDEAGNPLPGACFAAYGGGQPVSAQACDATDGTEDGVTVLRFPNGLPSADVDIVESFTPDGQPVSQPDELLIQSGDNQIQMIGQAGAEQPAEEEPQQEEPQEEEPQQEEPEEEEPAEPTALPEGPAYTLTFFAVDLNGAPLPGACFAIDGGEPFCDDDGDGTVIIPNVPAGTRTLSEPQSPPGYEAYPDVPLEITRDEQFSVPHNPGAGPTLDEEAEEGSTVELVSVDENGNALPFACYALEDGTQACDDDGNGTAVFSGLPNGSYTISQFQAPEGFEPVADFTIDVDGDESFQVPHQAAAAEEPEETEEPQETPAPEEGTGFAVGFVAVDDNQNGLPFACYTLDDRDELCDDDGDAIVTFENVTEGSHTLTQTQAPEGFESVGTLEITVDGDQNFAVRHEPAAEPEEPTEEPGEEPTEEAVEGLTVGFVSVDPDDNGLPGACFQLDDGEEQCDDDGDAEVTFTGVQPGPHVLTETQPPEGFENVGSLDLDLQNDGRFAIRHQPAEGEVAPEETPAEEPAEPGALGEIVATTVDQDGNELPEVCYVISTLGEQCDGDDEDNLMTQTDVVPGDYTIELVTPEGYEVVGDSTQTITVGDGESVEVQFQVQQAGELPEEEPEGAGSIQAVATEDGFPIIDACIQYEGPASGEVCDNQEGDDSPEQGVVLISNLPAGDYTVAMPNPPEGFDTAAPVDVSVADGDLAAVELPVGGAAPEEPTETPEPEATEEPTQTPEPEATEEPTPTAAPESGNLTIVKTNPDGAPLGGACFQIGDVVEICDNQDGDADGQDGVIRIEGLPTGDQTVTETVAPEGFIAAEPASVTIDPAGEAQLQVTNQPEPPETGAFRVVKREPDRTRLGGSCFALVGAEGTLGPWCDGGEGDVDDRTGVMEIQDVPVGDYTLTETQAPEGFLAAPDQPMTIVAGERAGVTVVNEPANGSLAITKTDAEGNPFVGACFTIGNALGVCDNGEDDANPEEGAILLEGIAAGSYTVAEEAISGFVTPDPQDVQITGGETAQLSFVNVPSLGDVQIQKTDDAGEPLGGACFTIGELSVCDNDETDANGDAGIIEVAAVPAGPVTVTETSAPEGFAIAGEAQTVDIVADETASVSFTNTRLVGAIGITKTDNAGEPLGGACFTVGDLSVCDNDETDANADAGVIEVTGIPAGPVTVSETSAPEGYEIAGEPQSVDVVADETATVSFANTPLTGTLQIQKTNDVGEPLGGACFTVGELSICDNDENDANGDGGFIEVGNLPAGPVTVTETSAPAGYNVDVEPQTVDVIPSETVPVSFTNALIVGSVSITKTDDAGAPVGGACFVVDGREVCDNGEGDGDDVEGTILVSDIAVGPINVTESSAPEGYIASTDTQSVEIFENEVTPLTFVNARRLGAVSITKTNDAGEPLGGACFTVGEQSVCDNDEGDGNEETGIVDIGNVPVGSVEIAESTVPEGYAGSDPQTVDVVEGETAGATFVNTLLVGSISIAKTNEAGEPLGGACFTFDGQIVCDNEDGDGNEETGFIDVSGVPVGSVEIVESTAPAGYAIAGDPQTVDVVSGETASVTFTNVQLLGAVSITKTDQDGIPLGGACFSLAGREVCDDGEGDENGEAGIIDVSGVPVGSVEIAETTVPEGYSGSEPQSADVTEGETAAVTFVNTRLVGSVSITKTNDAGEPLGGACFTVGEQTVCDNDEGDGNEETGIVDIGNVPVGSVEITESTVPEGYAGSDPQTVDVVAGEVATATFTNVQLFGAVSITKTDQDGVPLGGACFTVGGREVCDNGEGDGNGETGFIDVSGVPVGAVEIAESTVPEGYAGGDPLAVDVVEGETARATFVNTLLTGGVSITKADEAGEPLAGACFSVGEQTVCDNEEGDGNDEPGIIEVGNVPVGPVTVTESTVPEGYSGSEPQTVEVASGETAPVAFTNARLVGSLQIAKTDADGNPFAGACFTVGDETGVCDNDEADADPEEGSILIESIPTGSYSVSESPVEGFVTPEPQEITITGGETAQAVFVNVPDIGAVVIQKTDEDGEPLGGACFSVGGQDVCDNGEGDGNDEAGTIAVSGVPTGSVEIVETTAPEGYAPGEPQTIEIALNGTATTTFVNQLLVGSVQIQSTDQEGVPLGGACFSVGGEVICDNDEGDANQDEGFVQVDDVPVGTVQVAETTAPEEFGPGAPQSVEVADGETTTVNFTNTVLRGSIRIEKTDQAGAPLGGSCFVVDGRDVCDNGEGDENDETGVIEISGIAVGPINVTETSAPEGYLFDTEPRSVEVIANGEVPLTVVNTRATGGVSISKTDEAGEPLAGACFTVGEQEVCDNGEGDENDAEGVIDVSGIPTGPVSVAETTAPEGYVLSAGTQTVEVTTEAMATVSIANIRALGGVSISKTDEAGEPLDGACFTIGDQEICDNGEGDENDAEGVIDVSGIPTGSVAVAETVAPEGYVLSTEARDVQVTADSMAPVTVVNTRALGGISISKTDEGGEPLGGSCFTIGEQEVCDNAEGDENDAEGIIDVSGIPTGSVSVTETTAPDGYVITTDTQAVEVTEGAVTPLTVVNSRAVGGVSITKTDQDGNPLGGACFTIGEQEICDNGEGDENGSDGTIVLTGIPTGPVSVTETVTPDGYVLSTESQNVDVTQGSLAPLTVVNVRALGGVSITKTDEEGNPLGGACFSIGEMSVCDNGEGDGNEEEGTIEVSGVPTGTVSVTETTAPDGFVLPTEAQTVEVAEGEVAPLAISNTRAVGSVSITKTDEAGEPLGGSCFVVEAQEVCDNAEGDGNDEEGIIQISDVPTGSRSVTETVAPEGYVISTGPQTVDVTTDEDAQLTVTNTRATGSVSITKTDEAGDPLGGSCFTIGEQEVCDNGEGDTNDAEGTIDAAGIPTGSVAVTESSAPEGYVLSTETQTVEVATDAVATVTLANVRDVGTISISKTDEAGEPLGGACFVIGEQEVCDNGEGDQDDTEGTIVVGDIPTGSASVTETTAPDGYVLSTETQSVEVSAGAVAELTVVNARATGGVSIAKTDEMGAPLGGTCFTVGEQEVCDNGDGDENDTEGTIDVSGIPTGSISITETSAPEGYVVSTEPRTVEITADGMAPVTVVNTRAVGGLTIVKTDETGDPLGGACFTIGSREVCDNQDGDGNPDEGTIEIVGIPTGSVDVVESTTPEGFVTANPQTVDITEGGSGVVTFANVPAVGTVRIIKNDETGEPLAGACFEIGGAGACDNAGEDQDPADGVIEIAEVPAGTQDIVETTVPEGYAAPEETAQVEVAVGETAEVTVVNTRQLGMLQINKVDADDQSIVLGGACFEIAETDFAVCDNEDGDADPAEGVIRIEGIPTGDYQLVETQAPEGYDLAAETPVTIAPNEVTTVMVGDPRQTGSVRIFKTDSEDGSLALAGACFSVGGGEPVCDNGEGDVDPADGRIEIAGVPAGTQEVTETTPPQDYIAGDPVSVEVPIGGVVETTITNQRSEGTVRIEKTDEATGEPLGGACFAIDGDEPICDNDENDGEPAEGVLLITTTPGERTVVETQAPEGYDVVSGPQTVTVPLGDTVSIAVTNTRFTGSLRVAKIDNSTDEPLAGACFTIEGVEDTSYGPVCDNGEGDGDPAEGNTLIQGIEPGTYSVTESTAPPGFVIPPGPVAQGVQVAGGDVAEVVVANDPVGVATPVPVDLGGVSIAKTDDQGAPLGGACFALSGDTSVGPVCDDQAGDTNPEPGQIDIQNVPAGSYMLEETTTPEGFSAGAAQSVDVEAGQVTSVQVENSSSEPESGSLRIRTTSEGGDLQGGACFDYGAGNICDNDPGDLDPVPGEILISGLAVGDYTLTQTIPPSGFVLADTRTVTIEADQETVEEIAHEEAPVETGGLEFQLTDPNGNPVEGGCVALSSENNQAEDLVACDGGELDTNPDPGVLVVQDLPVGVFSVSQASVSAGETTRVDGVSFRMAVQDGDETLNPTQLQAVSEKTVEVKANVIVVVIIIIIIDAPEDGALEIVKRSDDTNILQGNACFEVSGQGNTIEICDNDGVDANLTVGVIRFLNLAEGVYSITETQSPPGYDPAPDQDAAVVGGLITTITIKDPPTPDPLGDLIVLKVDPEGTLIPGTCFELRQGTEVIAGPTCDDEDGDDGVVTFLDIEPGNYMLRETQAASPDYLPVADQPVTVVAGQELEVPVVNTLKPGSILITKLDDEGSGPLAGACFGLDRGNGIEFETCDQEPGDGDFEEGIILMNAIPPGEYTLIETVAPPGFEAGGETEIEVEPNTQLLLEIENTPAVPPDETGDLTILKRDSSGDPLPGACFALRQGPVIKVPQVCDEDDGTDDGTIRFEDAGVGQYGVIETRKPSADYQTPPEKFVTISSDQNTSIVIVNVLKRGQILVQKVNQQDQPLANACFKVTPGFHAVKCTNGSGNAVFENLPPGVYTVTETQAPYGYLNAPPVTNIVVKPGLTTPVKIVNKKAPPPPDAGSLRVIKFFCPLLGQSEDLTQVFDSSDANQKVLAQTANCKKGDATFVLKPKTPGDIISIKFVTGADGIAHLTLPSGSYTLTEQATKVTVEVRVFVGQQTTVVVLNYVPPPPPAPVSINVFKYTCDPGFQGQFYLDFINGCGSTEALTNGVTFRISGAAIQSRVTGDGGERGRTLFSQLPPGLYTLKEDSPAGSGTTYMWCGLTLEGSEFGAVATQISFPLSSGQTMYCAAFNVPDEVTDATGSIVVQKYACELPQVKRPANFDWFGECGPQGTGVKFSISELLDGVYVPKATGVTNVNGILSFSGLRPGTYKLQEVGNDWCHAESDSVNVDGDVLVRAGERANVWIFNCIPTVDPPNTGAGTTAGTVLPGTIQAPDGTNSAASLAVWPALALAGLAIRRRWMNTRAA